MWTFPSRGTAKPSRGESSRLTPVKAHPQTVQPSLGRETGSMAAVWKMWTFSGQDRRA